MLVFLPANMFGKNNNIKIRYGRNSFLEAIPKYLFIALLCFFFVNSQSAISASKHSKKDIVQENLNSFLSKHFVENSTPFHLPFESSPVIEESEINDINESANSFVYDINNQFHNYSSKTRFDSSNEISLWGQSTQCIYNHTTVSLFILYHSWKSFLI